MSGEKFLCIRQRRKKKTEKNIFVQVSFAEKRKIHNFVPSFKKGHKNDKNDFVGIQPFCLCRERRADVQTLCHNGARSLAAVKSDAQRKGGQGASASWILMRWNCSRPMPSRR